jgi:two-component system, OmpR family, phosphate regulon sensor histidine kinase PhoR
MTIRMDASFRLIAGIAVALITAALAWVAGGWIAGVIALVGVGAAVALAAPPRPAPAPPPAPVAPPQAEPGPQMLMEGLSFPVLLVRGGRVALANTPARALLGQHIVGEDVRVAVRHPAATEALAGKGAPADRPVELVGLGSREQRWLLRVGPVGDPADDARVVELTDETGHYATERMRVDFVANASHELRTPLASILGYAETLADEAGADPALRARFLQVMTDEARRMQRLVEDLLSLSRIEGDKHRLPTARVELGGLIERVRDELRTAGHPRVADVVCRIQPDLPPVAGDEAQLSQLLHNLIGNAMKYGLPGTPVTVELDRGERDTLRLSVTDRGDGIAAEHIPRLTERFYRVDAGRSRSLGGTGLGLAIVKHIVERHRGRFDIASKVGEGTAVAVTLPSAPSA